MARSARRRPAAKKPDPETRIIEAALALAERRGWRETSLADIAAEAEMPLLELYRLYRSKTAILEALHRRIDAEVLAGTEESEDERPRDRLFDVLMRRFDALARHKAAIRAMLRDTPRDPIAALCGAPAFLQSMGWMLEAAGISAAGWRGAARTHLLAGIYLSVLRVWLDDESTDMMKTMAALDRRLRGAASWLGVADAGAAPAAGAS